MYKANCLDAFLDLLKWVPGRIWSKKKQSQAISKRKELKELQNMDDKKNQRNYH